MKVIKTTCPLNCWDQCGLVVREEQGRIVSIDPDPDQPATGGIICSKGREHADRVNHPLRLRHPLLKKNGSFKEIDWPQALKIMEDQIQKALDKGGPQALMHYYDAGYSGLLKNIESRFFSALGGCTVHRGSLCWGAGLAAQKYDFGSALAHPYHDLLNSRLILVWGRNPANTSIHLQSFIQRAGQKGTRVIVIDPVRTATSKAANLHLGIKPGTDGVLALAMARVIIENGLQDQDFIDQSSSGFEQFAGLCKEYTTDKAFELTGLDPEVIKQLALEYARSKPAAILIGIGPQRHSNGGNMVRAIDALAALTGNIGVSGGGANYANLRVTRHIDQSFLRGDDLGPNRRYYPKPRLAESLLNFNDPAVQFMYISRSNPLVQVGDSSRMHEAFSRVPFKVTSEHFLTDTAAVSDLILPATYFLEKEDLYFNAMSHQYLNYGPRLVDPPGECRAEYEIFRELASLLEIKGFPDWAPDDILSRVIRPLTGETEINIENIRGKGPLLIPGGDDIPWANRVFATADGKYNFYSAAAQQDGCDALPCYREPLELSNLSLWNQGYRHWFLTPHPRDSIHSIHRLPDGDDNPRAYIHPETAEKESLSDGMQVIVSSKRGSIKLVVSVSDRIPPDTVMVYEGWWHFSGAAVNNLTPDRITDMGNQAAYYDCLCRIDPA